jgi:hypothetical protein
MREVNDNQKMPSINGFNNAIVVDTPASQPKDEPTLETDSQQGSVPLRLPESAYLLTILRKASAESSESVDPGRILGSGHSTPNIIHEDNGPVAEVIKPLPKPSAIRLNSFLIKPRVISAVSGKAIFKDAYTGGGGGGGGGNSKKIQQRAKIGHPLAMPPRLPSVGAGEILVSKRKKHVATLIP